MIRTTTDGVPTAALLYIFYEGHIDDPIPIAHRKVKFSLVADLFSPPWVKTPTGIPYEVRSIEHQLERWLTKNVP